MALPLKTIKGRTGQALIESLAASLLFLALASAVFCTVLTSTQIFVWHQKTNQALACALDDSKLKSCFQEFNMNLGQREKFRLTLVKFNFQKQHQRPQLEIELKGFFNEIYKIKKRISSTQWKI